MAALNSTHDASFLVMCPSPFPDVALTKTPEEGVGFVSYKGGQRKITIVTAADFNDWNGRIGTAAGLIGDTMRLMNLDSSVIP